MVMARASGRTVFVPPRTAGDTPGWALRGLALSPSSQRGWCLWWGGESATPAGTGGGQDPKKMAPPKPPHQHHSTKDAVHAPTSFRGGHTGPETHRTADMFESRRQRDVLHQRDWWKAPNGVKCRASGKDGLIAGGNASQARAQVHHESNQR